VRPDEIYESKAAADTASPETWAAAAITAFPITLCTCWQTWLGIAHAKPTLIAAFAVPLVCKITWC
jgi:hypothetical protein